MIRHLSLYILAISLFARAEGLYHYQLRSQLAAEFGLTGGEWILPDDEIQTNSRLQCVNCTSSITAWRGPEPFSQIVRIKVDSIRINPWDQAVRINTLAPIHKGDALLLIIWMNNADSLQAAHGITHVFEATTSPFEKSLYVDGKIREGWRQWLLPFEAERDYAANSGRFQINLGHMEGEIEIAGLAILNFGSALSVNDLPISYYHLEYDGHEDNAAWRTEALQRINKIRKGALSIKVLNKYNEPIEGAIVRIKMRKHRFGFGSAVSAAMWQDDAYDNRIYQQKLENLTGDGRSFNIVAIESALKWRAWEDPSSQGTRQDVIKVIEWLKDRGMRIRGHNLLWPSWTYMPDDMQEHRDNSDYLINRIQSHIYEQVRYSGIKGMIDEWDVINEMGSCRDLVDALGSDAIYADVMRWTAQSDPMAKLFLNENDIISNGGLKKTSREHYRTLIEKLSLTNAPIHGIGFQGHMKESFTPPETLLSIFDEFAAYGMEISITEYDAVGAHEQLAADYMRDILIAAFSHPSVSSFIMWGFWDGAHWQNDSPLFRRDWSIKPSGQTFITWVFHNWWTNEEGKSTKNGEFVTSAFYGEYSIEIEFDGQRTEALVDFSPESKEIILYVDSELTSASPPIFYKLQQNYPNPFNGSTTVTYELPRRDRVVIDLFDIRGRHVRTLLDEHQAEGTHTLQIDAGDLPSALYYYRMKSGDFKQTRKMLLIR